MIVSDKNEIFTDSNIGVCCISTVGPFVIPSIPLVFGILAYFDIVSLCTFKIALLVCVVLFIIFPVIFKYSYNLQSKVIFLNFVNIPVNANYQHPEKYGLKGSRNFYITTSDNVTLGVWHILPSNLENSTQLEDHFFENILDNGQNIVIYSHGNGGSRVVSHRIETYKFLRKHFHVIAFDYRSYGDSSKSSPTELALVSDIVNVYKWVRNKTSSNVFMWGHSLGSSLSTHSILKIQTLQLEQPLGLILESPFNNMKEEISEFPLAKMFKYLPWFHVTVVEPMAENFHFETDKYICGINVPIMILHAQDDRVVPFRLGYKLYETATECRHGSQGNVVFHAFGGEKKFGHKYVTRANDLHDKLRTATNKRLGQSQKIRSRL